ncbi:CoA-binding protein [Natronococcus occultus]|uniref:Putative CoA-binding protein n=1 Tax=Natronococcus occultus SP4 TaxID=694430 RepID=L0JV71_9EURY|nr:CoA-binding protein [Natronococcus occultus]AGB36907.1 putative CoA-binding protein [Natronococcus occultus SP4]
MPVTDADRLREIFEYETIAVVGCSSTPGKAAHDVPRYLLEQGYDVIPINPNATEIFDRPAAASLSDVDREIDVVCLFRPSEEVAGIVDDVLEREDVPVIWTQLGISDDEAAARAEESGRAVVQDRCMKVEHRRHVA